MQWLNKNGVVQKVAGDTISSAVAIESLEFFVRNGTLLCTLVNTVKFYDCSLYLNLCV